MFKAFSKLHRGPYTSVIQESSFSARKVLTTLHFSTDHHAPPHDQAYVPRCKSQHIGHLIFCNFNCLRSEKTLLVREHSWQQRRRECMLYNAFMLGVEGREGNHAMSLADRCCSWTEDFGGIPPTPDLLHLGKYKAFCIKASMPIEATLTMDFNSELLSPFRTISTLIRTFIHYLRSL